MKKWYNFETNSSALKEDLGVFLKKSGIYYECAGCFSGYHFEINATEEEARKINDWLDTNENNK